MKLNLQKQHLILSEVTLKTINDASFIVKNSSTEKVLGSAF